MIPPFNAHQLLPPYVGEQTLMASHSPYKTTMSAVVERFAFSPRRRTLVGGLLDFRAALRAAGMVDGFQWLAGSFVEHRETEPQDVDVVTLHTLDPAAEDAFVVGHPGLVDSVAARSRHGVDAQFVSLRATHPWTPIRDSVFWIGLFGHQRDTPRWKGLPQLQLDTAREDAAARALLLQTAP